MKCRFKVSFCQAMSLNLKKLKDDLEGISKMEDDIFKKLDYYLSEKRNTLFEIPYRSLYIKSYSIHT